jgi:hypothetical protein
LPKTAVGIDPLDGLVSVHQPRDLEFRRLAGSVLAPFNTAGQGMRANREEGQGAERTKAAGKNPSTQRRVSDV